MNMSNENPYVYAGKLDSSVSVYVKREADDILEEKLREGELCYVFNARKQGKSSLLEQVTSQLSNDYICLKISMAGIQTVSAQSDKLIDKFYQDILEKLIKQLKVNKSINMKINRVRWIEEYAVGLTNIGTLQAFFDFILSKIDNSKKLIIVIDEIDSVKSLPFSTDDLFATIRDLYQDVNYQRLIFCLLGAIRVSDLIMDRTRTPFNVGIPIDLNKFSFEQAQKVLITSALKEKVEDAEQALRTVLRETKGQPYLTQKVLAKIIDYIPSKISQQKQESEILKIVKEYIIDNWKTQDIHDYFKYSEARICRQDKETQTLINEQNTLILLNLYQQILESTEGIKWIETDAQHELVLSGLIINENGNLIPSSPIHKQIFNHDWIKSWLAKIKLFWYQDKKTAWEKSNPDDPSKRDKFYLLYGDELNYANENYKRSSREDEAFIDKSDKCYQNDIGGLRHNRVGILNEQQKEIIVNRMRYWTNYDKEIFEELMSIVNRNDNDIPDLSMGKEEDWVDRLVQECIITKWNDIDILSQIYQAIQKQEENKRFDLLVTYGKILKGKIIFDENNQEQKFLLDIGLVKRRYREDGYYIEVSNPIYRCIFDEGYINKMLPNTREYGKKLGMWLITQDDQYLLSAEELESHIILLHNQKLSEDEHLFLLKSQLNIF